MLLQYILNLGNIVSCFTKLDGLSNLTVSVNICSYYSMIILLYTIAIPSDQIGIDMVLNALLLVNLNKLLLINTKL